MDHASAPDQMTTPLTRDAVVDAYRVLLGRAPVPGEPIDNHLQHPSHARMVHDIALSEEARARLAIQLPNPLLHYNTCVDVRGIVERNIDHGRQPRAGHNVNFLGVAVPVEVFPFLADTGGTLDQIPIPANYHADMAEWAAALRPVEAATDTFTMIELGCGWGCWMVNTGVVAKRRGLKIELIGVEGDPLHVDLCHRTMASNDIEAVEYHVVRGVAAGSSGIALFPRRQEGEDNWGFEPIFGATEQQRDELVGNGSYESLEMIALRDVIGDRPCINLLHIDIQGGEGLLVRETAELLTERVGHILIGTHSRMLEGELMTVLFDHGWRIEIERPAIFSLENGVPTTRIDGVQGWVNPRFHPVPA